MWTKRYVGRVGPFLEITPREVFEEIRVGTLPGHAIIARADSIHLPTSLFLRPFRPMNMSEPETEHSLRGADTVII